MSGKLYIVATPIGNLEDTTLRALRTLSNCNLIACEDTRHTRILLEKYGIKVPLISYHQHSRLQKIDYIISKLLAGQSIALVSDAGTPGISDPGGILVAKALQKNIKVIPIPGASALVTLASVSGIPLDKFLFLGFLPHKKGRKSQIQTILNSDLPVIFYESPHRIEKTLAALADSEGRVIVGRELTKKFEEIIRGTTKEVYQQILGQRIQGEFVVIYHR